MGRVILSTGKTTTVVAMEYQTASNIVFLTIFIQIFNGLLDQEYRNQGRYREKGC